MTVLYSLVSLVSPLIIFITCCYYISKQVKIDSILMLIGSAISILISVLYNIVMPFLMQSRNLSITETSSYYSIAGFIGFFGGISFAAGVLILVYNTVNSFKTFPDSFPPNEFK